MSNNGRGHSEPHGVVTSVVSSSSSSAMEELQRKRRISARDEAEEEEEDEVIGPLPADLDPDGVQATKKIKRAVIQCRLIA